MEIWVLSKYFFLPALSTFFILKTITWLINNQYSSSKKNPPPSPPKLPIIGNLHQLSFHFRSLKSLSEKYGPVVQIQLGTRPALIISSAEAAEEVLKKHDLSFAQRPRMVYARKFAYGYKDLIFAPYCEYWRQIRSICVSQLLSSKRVQSFRTVREEEIVKTLETTKQSCSSVCNMSDIFANLSFDIFFRSAFGKRNSEEKDGNFFKPLTEEANKLAVRANIGDVIPWLGWINHVNGVEARVKRLFKEADKYLESVINEAVEKSRERDDHRDRGSFMDVLLEYQREEEDSGANGFTLHRDSVKALIVNMVFGGEGTTHAVLGWTLSELMRNSEAMSKLQNEVRGINSGHDAEMMITEDDLGKLPYLKAVVRESLRMHPPFEYLYRESREAVTIQSYDVAPNTIVFIDVGTIGRNPKVWEDPDEFRPERFLVSNPADVNGQHFHFLPFGSGRRICPGSGAALVIIELAIANLIRKFSFTLPDGAKPEDLDMTEEFGVASSRKVPLLLVPALN